MMTFVFGGVMVARADTTYTCYNTCAPVYSNWIGRVILDLQCNGSSPASYTGWLTVNGVTIAYSKTCSSAGACGNRSTTYAASILDWPGGSVYCSVGSALSSPAFPNYAQTVTWTCGGVNGGPNSPLCSATRNLDTPAVTLTPTPASVSNINNNTLTPGTANITLNWNISNEAQACGTGCDCSFVEGGVPTGYNPYLTTKSANKTIGPGTTNFEITCRNPQNISGNATASVTATCTPQSGPPACDKPCGPGNTITPTLGNNCITNNSIVAGCPGNPNCPASTSFEEVRP